MTVSCCRFRSVTFVDILNLSQPENCLSSYDPHGFLVIYSSADRSSFLVAERVLQTLWTSENIAQKAVILVGNKADLARSRLVSSEGKWMIEKAFWILWFLKMPSKFVSFPQDKKKFPRRCRHNKQTNRKNSSYKAIATSKAIINSKATRGSVETCRTSLKNALENKYLRFSSLCKTPLNWICLLFFSYDKKIYDEACFSIPLEMFADVKKTLYRLLYATTKDVKKSMHIKN